MLYAYTAKTTMKWLGRTLPSTSAIILRWMIISLNFIDKQHEVFYCNENVTLTTTSKEITSFLIYFGL